MYKFALHEQKRSVPLPPYPLQHKLSSVFFILAILTDVRCYLRVVLICISLMSENVEQFLKCFWMFENLLLRILCLDLYLIINWIILYFDVYFMSSLYILEIISLSDVGL